MQSPWIRFFEILGKYAYQEAESGEFFMGYQKLQIEYGQKRIKLWSSPMEWI